MRWTPEAERLLDRVPPFVRAVARRAVEKRAMAQGLTEVTRALVLQAMPKRGGPSGDALARLIRDAEAEAERVADRSEGHELTVCGAVAGCPLALADVDDAFAGMRRVVHRIGLGDVIARRIDGPVLSHSRVKMTVAACPNACTEPQIKDVALVAYAWPAVGPAACDRCMACVKACPDACLRVDEAVPEVDRSVCVGCGRCISACTRGALVEQEAGWKVVAGGRLGRHPRLAIPVHEGLLPVEEALRVARCVLGFLVENGMPGERLGVILDRIGKPALKEVLDGR